MKIKLVAPHDQREDTLEMMTGILQTLARILPLYCVNGGLWASMVFDDHRTTLNDSAVIGIFAAAVFFLGIMTTTWSKEAT